MRIKDMLYVIMTKLKTTPWVNLSMVEGSGRYRIVNGMVWVSLWGLTPTNTWKVVTTLPQEIRPPVWVDTKGHFGGNGRNTMTVDINPNGEVNISTAETSSSSGSATVIYPLS